MSCVGGLGHAGEIVNGQKALIGVVEEETSRKSCSSQQNYFTTNLRGIGYMSLVLINLI